MSDGMPHADDCEIRLYPGDKTVRCDCHLSRSAADFEDWGY